EGREDDAEEEIERAENLGHLSNAEPANAMHLTLPCEGQVLPAAGRDSGTAGPASSKNRERLMFRPVRITATGPATSRSASSAAMGAAAEGSSTSWCSSSAQRIAWRIAASLTS